MWSSTKRNHKNILELKYTINEIKKKIQQRVSWTGSTNQKKESVNLKTELLILSIWSRKKEMKMKKRKESLCKLWNTVKWNNIHVIEVLEKEKRERIRKCKEIMADNFQTLGRDGHPDTWNLKIPKQIQPKEIFTETIYQTLECQR